MAVSASISGEVGREVGEPGQVTGTEIGSLPTDERDDLAHDPGIEPAAVALAQVERDDLGIRWLELPIEERLDHPSDLTTVRSDR